MSNRKDYYFRQKVTEAELDAGFDDLELADRNLVLDQDLVGVYQGLTVAQQVSANLTVQVSGPGVAYDQAGQRIAIPSTQNADMSVDASSVSTGVATPGNSRIVSLFIRFKRLLSDLRIDGNSASVYFVRSESYEFVVNAGAEAGSPTAPALLSDGILLADVTRVFGGTTIVNADISTTRREWAYSTANGIRAGTATAAFAALTATMIANTPAGGIAATTVQAAINELDTEKMPKTGGAFSAGITVPAASNYGYATTRQVDVNLCLGDARPNRAASTTWDFDRLWTCTSGDVTEHVLYFPLNGRIPRGAQITRYSITYDQSDASGSLFEIGYSTGGPTMAWTAIDSTGPVLGSAGDATFNSGALAHTFDDSTSRQYYVRIRANAGQASGLTIYNVSVRVLVTNLAP